MSDSHKFSDETYDPRTVPAGGFLRFGTPHRNDE